MPDVTNKSSTRAGLNVRLAPVSMFWTKDIGTVGLRFGMAPGVEAISRLAEYANNWARSAIDTAKNRDNLSTGTDLSSR